MNKVAFDQRKTTQYLIWTFLIAWIVQVVVAVLYHNGLSIIGQLLMAAMMFVPLLGVLLAGGKLPGMGWKPRLKGNVRVLLAAWFLPVLFTAIGVLAYFAIFPGHFDLSGDYLAAAAGAEVLEQLEAKRPDGEDSYIRS